MTKKKKNVTFFDECLSSSPKINYPTNKTLVTIIDDVWSSNFLDLVEDGPSNSKVYSYILVNTDNFSKKR